MLKLEELLGDRYHQEHIEPRSSEGACNSA